MYKLTVMGTLEIDEHDAEILDALQGKHGEANQYEVAMQELSETCKDVKVTLGQGVIDLTTEEADLIADVLREPGYPLEQAKTAQRVLNKLGIEAILVTHCESESIAVATPQRIREMREMGLEVTTI